MNGRGTVYGPYRYNKGKIIQHCYVATFDDGYRVLKKLWPFLSGIKREQAEAVLRAIEWPSLDI